MRIALCVAVSGALFAVSVRARADFPGECPVDQIGQPCSNAFEGHPGIDTYCTAVVCEQIEDKLNDAGEDVGVPVSCSICGACVGFCSDTAPCPGGALCTAQGYQAWGFGPLDNPDETTLFFPDFECDEGPVEAGVDYYHPWTPSCDAAGGPIGSPGTGSSSGSTDSGSSSAPWVSGPSTEAGDLEGDAIAYAPAPSQGGADAGATAANAARIEELRSGMCSFAFGPQPMAPAAFLPLGVVGGLLAMRRRRRTLAHRASARP
jgi:MYXO-CTERM domain-containing protein